MKAAKVSPLEESLLAQIRLAGLPAPVEQLVFAKGLGRLWRFDLAYPGAKLAVEVDGGSFGPGGGHHGSGQGAENDAVKAAVACLMGWVVYRVNTHMVKDGRALFLIRSFLTPDVGAAAKLAGWKCSACDLTKTRRRQKARQKAREAKQ